MATAAQLVAQRLYEAGCRHAFGIPGGEVLTVMEALKAAGLEFVLVKHENSGGFMAEGTFHVTGAPGVLLATVGPGVANAVNVIVNAEQDRVPLIFLTGCVDPAEAQTYNHQVFDHAALIGSVGKASFTLVDGAVDTIIDKAVSIAMDGRPGPVHIDISTAIAGREQPAEALTRRVMPAPVAPASGPDLDFARKLLRNAERPVLIAGVEVLEHDAADTVAAFARDFSIPAITTYKAKGVLPENDPLSLGGWGLSPLGDSHLLPLVETSDLILLAGYDPIEMRSSWVKAWDVEKTAVIEFSGVPNTHYVHQASLSFIGNVGAGIATLRKGVEPHPVWSNSAPLETRKVLAEAFPTDEAWGPAAICDEVNRLLPDDAIASVDTGAHRILLSSVWRAKKPHTLIQSSALCTMGCALPLAMGAKLADPSRPVVAFTGDAGLEMILGELATLRDLRLPVVTVVFVDASLALIEMKQRASGMDNLGVDFGKTDFAAVACALGGNGVDVDNRSDLASAVSDGLTAGTFTVIAAHIDRTAYDGRI
ncbi:MAG: acetolactate synthase [Rhodospirillaceae bacterium]|nr:acetolactate synthase [Rhodospirillaceae bacterium]